MEMTVKIEGPNPSGEGGDNRGWVLINVKMVLGLLGAAACLGWIAITLMSGPLGTRDPQVETQSTIAHIAFLIGIVAALACAAPLSDFWSRHRVSYFALSAVLIGSGIIVALFNEIDSLFLWGGFALCGIGAGCLYTLYGEYLSSYFSNGIEPYTHSVLLMTAALVAGYFFVFSDYHIAYWSAIAVVAFLGYLSQMAFYKVHKLPYKEWKESRPRSKVQKRSYFSTTSGGIMLGFALGATFTIGSGDQTAFLIGTIVVVAMCGYLLYDSLTKRRLGEKVSMHWFLPLAAVFAFPMLFVPGDIAFIFAVLMACFAILPTSCSMSAICRHIHICDLAAIGQFGFGRLFNFAGILVGVIVSYVGFSQVATLYMGHYAISAAICAFMMLTIASCSFVMIEDNYPSDERIRVVEDEVGGKTVTVGPGTPIHSLNAGIEPAMAEASEPHIGIFQLKCDIVAEKYGLSRRQAEVLGMLARGRGADYITEKLVISPHTAKAHTYNIYLKLDVHSRQELMDLVESTEVTEEDIAKAREKIA